MNKVSRFISTEWDKVDCPHVDLDGQPLLRMPDRLGGDTSHPIWIHPLIASVFDAVRDKWGSPILVTRGVVCLAYQEVLVNLWDKNREEAIKRGIVARPAEISPHCYGVALDVVPEDTPDLSIVTHTEVATACMVLAEAIHEVDPEIRIFTARYGFKFVHLDCSFVLSDPLPDGRKKPESWKGGVRDWLV